MLASQRIAGGPLRERAGTWRSRQIQDELGQLALSFNRMAAKLEQVEGMRRQLIGDVTHELRTPLTTIKGSMEGLMDGVLAVTRDLSADLPGDRPPPAPGRRSTRAQPGRSESI